MSLRLKIIIGVLSLVIATIVVLGDGVLHAMGLPRGIGRVSFLAALALGIAVFLWVGRVKDRKLDTRAPMDKAEPR